MKSKDDDAKKVQLNSIQNAWGKHDEWLELRENAIEKAVAVYKTSDALRLTDLYSFLTEERAVISEILDQNCAKNIRQTRLDGLYSTASTALYGRTYEQFQQLCVDEFDKLCAINANNTGEEKKSNTPLLKYILKIDPKDIQSECIPTYSISSGGKTYSEFYKITLNDNKQAIVILHTNGVKDLPGILHQVNQLNERIKSARTDDEKIRIIKHISWYLFQAMPQTRGSASISEMVMETLLRAHNIPYSSIKSANNSKLPYDIMALFSNSPEEFEQKITIHRDTSPKKHHVNKQTSPTSESVEEKSEPARASSCGIFSVKKPNVNEEPVPSETINIIKT